jgi:two-component system chemotaxis response regulator CheB
MNMQKHDIIVIGASAGGLDPLKKLMNTLPKNFNASIFIVMHLAPQFPSNLPWILSKAAPFEVKHPTDGETIKAKQIYVAPPDHHLLIENKKVYVKKGPKENRFRPSIDALFRSAAYTYGSRVVGVVLSGLLDDGTSGMWTIKRLGGLCIIQDPADAVCESMPQNVQKFIDVDFMVPADEIGSLLGKLVEEPAKETHALTEEELKRLNTEIKIANQDNAFGMGILEMGKPTSLTCPECHGTLVSIREGKIMRYRCHTGHAFTAGALLADVSRSVEDTLWSALRGLEETIMILEEMGKNFPENEDDGKEFFAKAEEIRQRSAKLRNFLFEQEQRSGEKLNDEIMNEKTMNDK